MDIVAQRLGLSRTPVREALRLLEGEGLVRALPNRGFTVRVTTVAETAHLFDARLCIERFTAEVAFERRTDAFLRELCAIQRTYRRVLKGAMNRRLGMVADKAFHVRISAQAGNPVLIDVQKKLFDTIIFTRALDGFSLARSDTAIAEHERIVAALQGSSRERVVEAVAVNVIQGRDAIIAYLQEQELVRRSV
jgi:DNA-binding GntR family transcriptional regulator